MTTSKCIAVAMDWMIGFVAKKIQATRAARNRSRVSVSHPNLKDRACDDLRRGTARAGAQGTAILAAQRTRLHCRFHYRWVMSLSSCGCQTPRGRERLRVGSGDVMPASDTGQHSAQSSPARCAAATAELAPPGMAVAALGGAAAGPGRPSSCFASRNA